MQSVGVRQAAISIWPLHKFVAESGPPLGCVCSRLRKRFEMQTTGIFSSDFESESIVEAEGRSERESQAILIFAFDLGINLFTVPFWLLLEDGSDGGTGVLGAHINSS